MSLELKRCQLFEFKPSALETFDLNRQGKCKTTFDWANT